jgi:hypothetical protein
MNQNMTAILDFDDLMDGNDPLDALTVLKERDPGFKVTLFAIPTRCSEILLEKYKSRADWIQLGIHGWRHSRHECLAWTSEETEEKADLAMKIYPHFAPIFKAPNWETCDEVYAGLKSKGIAIADHIRNIEILPAGMPHYIYNVRLRNDTFKRLHGHIQNWNGTGLTEKANGHGVNPEYILPVGTRYGFCTEAASDRQALAI